MIWIGRRDRTELKKIVIVSDVFEEPVVGRKHLLRKQVKPFSSDAAVVNADFFVESDVQSAVKQVRRTRINSTVG